MMTMLIKIMNMTIKQIYKTIKYKARIPVKINRTARRVRIAVERLTPAVTGTPERNNQFQRE